jgi:hypothetical protein
LRHQIRVCGVNSVPTWSIARRSAKPIGLRILAMSKEVGRLDQMQIVFTRIAAM